MREGLPRVLLCVFFIVGEMRAQEVILARETKPIAARRAPPPPEQTEQTRSPTPAETKRRSRPRKTDSNEPTLEQMRMAGALAAEGKTSERSVSRRSKTRETISETAAVNEPPVNSPTPRPRKKGRAEESEIPRPTRTRASGAGAIGPVRTTLLESGREAPSPSPPAREQSQSP